MRKRLVSFCRDITERKRVETALTTRVRQLEAVRGVSTELTRELDLPVLLDLVIRRAVELFDATSGTVRLWDDQTQTLVPVAWHGLGSWLQGHRRRLGEGLSGRVAQRREGLIVNEYRTSPYATPRVLAETEITAILAEPLLYSGEDLPLPPETVGIHLYRVLREALTNIIKHARAHRVQVALEAVDGMIRLVVEDDGVGFDLDASESQPSGMGIGLLSMREWVEQLQGRLEIISRPGRGTRLVARIPTLEGP